MGQLGKIYSKLDPILQEIGESNLEICYSSEEIVNSVFSEID